MVPRGRRLKSNRIVSRIIGSLIAAGLVMIGEPASANAADCPDCPYDALTYSNYFWSNNVVFKGDDPDNRQTPGSGRGDIWTLEQWGPDWAPCLPADLPLRVSRGYQWTFVNTHINENPSLPRPDWFSASDLSNLEERATKQPQRDPVTGRILCKSYRLGCDDKPGDQKNNYYDWERIQKVNSGEDSLPEEFWYPQFEPLIDPVTNEPVTNPATGQPVLRRIPPNPATDEPNVVVLDFKDAPATIKPEDVILTPQQRKVGGFLVILNVSERSGVICPTPTPKPTPSPSSGTAPDCFCKDGCFRFEVTSDLAELDTVIYQSEPDADLVLYSWNLSPSRWDLRGAVWGGRIIDIWTSWTDIAGPTVTYEATYADAIKRLFKP